MSKRQFFIALGAFVLATAGVMAGRANSKSSASSLAFKTASGTCITVANALSSTNFTTVNSGALHQARMTTAGGNRVNFYTAGSSCSKPVYLVI